MPDAETKNDSIVAKISEILDPSTHELNISCQTEIEGLTEGTVIGYYVGNSEISTNMDLSILVADSSGRINCITLSEGSSFLRIFSFDCTENPIPADSRNLVELPWRIFNSSIYSKSLLHKDAVNDPMYYVNLLTYAKALNKLLRSEDFILQMASQTTKLKGLIETINIYLDILKKGKIIEN